MSDALATRIDSAPEFLDEVEQELRLRLITGAEPRLLQYTASGGLLDWLRVAALRTALNLKRSVRRLVPTDELPLAPLVDPGGELHALKDVALPGFRQAVEASFARLGPRDRTLLRLHFVDGLSIDAIGTMYGAHRATVARWLVAIRRTLFEETRTLLAGVAQPLDSRSLRSLYRMLEPDLHVTLSGLLARQPPGNH